MSAAIAAVPAADQPKSKLVFHRDFNKKAAGNGDVILQGDADLKLCFYFRLARLAELSSFFADLPPPSPDDLIDGTPLIPLHNTSSAALLVSLLAIRSLTQAEPFMLPHMRRPIRICLTALVEAAVLAKMYDIPILYRLILDGSRRLPNAAPFLERVYLEFTIWAIAGVKRQIVDGATGTLTADITSAPRELVTALRNHAPDCLYKLQALHLRRAHGARRFYAEGGVDMTGGCEACLEKGLNHENFVNDRLRAAKTAEDVWGFAKDFGLSCLRCRQVLSDEFRAKLHWFEKFTSEYDFDMDLDEYLETRA